MLKSTFLVWLCVPAILFCSGCASFCVKTDLKPEEDAALQSPAGQFYIAGVNYKVGGDDADVAKRPSNDVDAVYERRLLPLVRAECLVRYPLLFTKDSSDSIALWITVDDSTDDLRPNILLMFCTLCIAPIVLPLPDDRERDISVTLGRGNSREGNYNTMCKKVFHRDEHGWLSFSPLGLISYPGDSDLPKVSSAFNMGRYGYDDVPQVAQQVATAIAKLVAAKEPEFWTSQPRTGASSTLSPARPVNPPVALPLPTEPMEPF